MIEKEAKKEVVIEKKALSPDAQGVYKNLNTGKVIVSKQNLDQAQWELVREIKTASFSATVKK